MVPGNKQNRRYEQINFIGLQNNRHPSQHTVGNIRKAKASIGINAEPQSHILGLPPRLQTVRLS
jgi:hypothetical protein